MSEVKSNAAAVDPIIVVDNDVLRKQLTLNGDQNKKKKRLSTFGVFKAAFGKLRNPPSEKEKPVFPVTKKASKGSNYWKKVIESMRPLHLQQSNSNPSSPLSAKSASTKVSSTAVEDIFQDLSQPTTPGTSSSSSEASMTPTSQYASATNLQELVNSSSNNLEELDDHKNETCIDDTSPYASANNIQEPGNYSSINTMSPYTTTNNLHKLDNQKLDGVGGTANGTITPCALANNLQEVDHHKHDDGIDIMNPHASPNNFLEVDNPKHDAVAANQYASYNILQEEPDGHKHDAVATKQYASYNILQEEPEGHKHDAGFYKHRHCASALNLQELDNRKPGSKIRHRQYASTNNLQLLYEHTDDDEDDEDEDPDRVFDSYRADDMIDAKADDFIARFYEQMKVQGRNSAHPYHRKTLARKKLQN